MALRDEVLKRGMKLMEDPRAKTRSISGWRRSPSLSAS